MRWFVFLTGVGLVVIGSAGAAALVTAARSDLTQAISRRLRGGDESFGWLAEAESLIVAAMALSSLGVALAGVAVPAIFNDVTVVQLGALLLFMIVPVMLLGGYLLPRWLTHSRAGQVVDWLRPPISALRSILGFVLPSGAHASTEDVQALAREGNASGLGSGEELALVGGVMGFAELPIRGLMTPRTDVEALAHDVVQATALETFSASGFSRLPVFKDSLDEVIGMVHAFDIFKLQPGDPLPIRPVVHAPESLTAVDLLVEMQRERRHLAVVLDEFGGTAGIVTLEDLLEALVGEISDEDDHEVVAPSPVGGLVELAGAEPTSRLNDHFGVTLPVGDSTSIAGLVAEKLGRIPVAGERFVISELEIDIVEANPARIIRVLVRSAGTQAVPLNRDNR